MAIFRKLMDCCGEPDQVLPELRCILEGHVDLTALNQLENGIQAMGKSGRKEVIRVDLSAVDDMRYYSGIVFKGYIQGVPGSVLSGGQYDHLMQKMGRTAGAIGFAVYIDDLERLEPAEAAR